MQEIGRCGLAVGAGHADERGGVGLGAVDGLRDIGDHLSRIADDERGQASFGGDVSTEFAGEEGNGASVASFVSKGCAVKARAGNADKERARGDRSGRADDARDRDIVAGVLGIHELGDCAQQDGLSVGRRGERRRRCMFIHRSQRYACTRMDF